VGGPDRVGLPLSDIVELPDGLAWIMWWSENLVALDA
jgi:hypothetical protein